MALQIHNCREPIRVAFRLRGFASVNDLATNLPNRAPWRSRKQVSGVATVYNCRSKRVGIDVSA